MRVEIRDYKTGWIGVEICLKDKDVDALVNSLKSLKHLEPGQHFNLSNLKLDGSVGVVSIEFNKDAESGVDTFQGPSSLVKG